MRLSSTEHQHGLSPKQHCETASPFQKAKRTDDKFGDIREANSRTHTWMNRSKSPIYFPPSLLFKTIPLDRNTNAIADFH